MSATTSPIRSAWYRWKSLKLPWRKRFLIGLDLQGNTFWEFRDTLSSHKHRMRRIVQYSASTHYSEIKISPQWHQWLRHTRSDPPSLSEQSEDLIRQRNLKVLAAQADARWASKPSFLDSPAEARGPPIIASEVKDPGGNVASIEPDNTATMRSATEGTEEITQTKEPAESDVEELGRISRAQAQRDGRRHLTEDRGHDKVPKTKDKKEAEDPWKRVRGGPSEEWQPASWSGDLATRR